MASITISGVTLATVPSTTQIVTIKYRLTSDPDVPSSYTTVSTNTVVNTNGTFGVPVTISGLLNNTSYTVVVTNNCSGNSFTQAFTTPLPSCVSITGMTGTTAG